MKSHILAALSRKPCRHIVEPPGAKRGAAKDRSRPPDRQKIVHERILSNGLTAPFSFALAWCVSRGRRLPQPSRDEGL